MTREALITPATTNFQVTSSFFSGRHEISTTFLTLGQPGPPPTGRWLAVWDALGNTANATAIGWAPSTDGFGMLWTPNELMHVGDFGNPGNAPCGGPFQGYLGDPAVATVTSPDLWNSGQRAILVNGAGLVSGGQIVSHNDVVALLTDDGGQTWGSPAYVDTATSCGGADIPHIASNPVAPYHTFVSWEVATNPSDLQAWIRRIWYDTSVPAKLCGGPPSGAACPGPIRIPFTPGPPRVDRRRPNIAFGKLADASGVPLSCTSGGEMVLVVSADFEPNVCDGNPYVEPAIHWYLQMYDVGWQKWYGPWLLYSDPGLPNCVARAPNGDPVTDNSDDPHIAGDTRTDWFWVTHTISLPCSGSACPNGAHRTSEVHADYGWFYCPTPNNPCPPGAPPDQPCPVIQQWTPPAGGSGTGAAWIPAIASTNTMTAVPQPPNPLQRTVIYWYSTREDTANNRMAAVYMSYEENYSLAFSPPARVSFATQGTMETVPWDNANAKYWDYQHLGANPWWGNFLAVWNDHRNSGTDPKDALLWSDLLSWQ